MPVHFYVIYFPILLISVIPYGMRIQHVFICMDRPVLRNCVILLLLDFSAFDHLFLIHRYHVRDAIKPEDAG